MKTPGFVLVLVSLALAAVVSIAATAGRPSAAGPPSVGDHVTEVAANITGPEPIGVTTKDSVQGRRAGLSNREGPHQVLDAQDLEEFRNLLLTLADTLDRFRPFAGSYSKQLDSKQPPMSPKVVQELIKELKDEELAMVRKSFDDANYEALLESIATLDSLLLSLEKGVGEGGKGPGASLASFTIIPTPTPTGPGIKHAEHESKNLAAGNILMKEGATDAQTAAYPTDVGCPKDRFSAELRSALETTLVVLKLAVSLADFGCDTIIVVCPLPGGTNAPGCIAKAVVDGLFEAAYAALDYLNYCNGGINSAEIEGTFFNTQILHADLIEHDNNLTARANNIDNFLFNFRNLNLETRIEANLASSTDDPISLLALPHSICIFDDLRGLPEFSPDRVAGCGLLEVVSDTVRSAIDMGVAAGQVVNNAEAEFQAALTHYDNGEWKLAYARFRKAYREVARPSP